MGLAEGRVGYLEGGGEGRWTIRSPEEVEGSYVYLSTSSRVAGAIDSLVWRDKEFLNSWDHGRQLQCAVTVQSWGECWNPTEAGGRDDGKGKTTKSEVISINAQNGSLTTANLPAYWLRAGHKTSIPSGDHCQAGDQSFNEVDTHQGTMEKVVTLGCFGLENCISFEIVASLGQEGQQPPSGWRFAQLEGPTAYLGHDFSGVSYLNLTSGSLVGERSESEKCDHPPVIHTPDEEFALGVISAPREAATGFPRLCYAYFSCAMTQWDSKTYKWSVVVRQEPEAGDVLEVTSYLCVGTLQMVADCLLAVSPHIVYKPLQHTRHKLPKTNVPHPIK